MEQSPKLTQTQLSIIRGRINRLNKRLLKKEKEVLKNMVASMVRWYGVWWRSANKRIRGSVTVKTNRERRSGKKHPWDCRKKFLDGKRDRIIKTGEAREARVKMVKMKLCILQRFGRCYPEALNILIDYMSKKGKLNSFEAIGKKYNTKPEVVRAIVELALPKLNELEDVDDYIDN